MTNQHEGLTVDSTEVACCSLTEEISFRVTLTLSKQTSDVFRSATQDVASTELGGFWLQSMIELQIRYFAGVGHMRHLY